MGRCPSFTCCSAPLCPLDADYAKRGRRQRGEARDDFHPQQAEDRCRSRKRTRVAIVEAALAEGGEVGALAGRLPYGGLTASEHKGIALGERSRARWAGMSEAERESERERLRAMREKAAS